MARTSRKQLPAAPKRTAVPEVFQTALYLRLSLEDNGKKDADSLENQRALLDSFIAERPFLELVDIYADNGFTGTDFNRPEFNRMMEDVRRKRINCIVVKDLSRLGRNYVETGDYLEKIFPFLGVRFIAVNDCYDSSNIHSSDQLAATLKNLINDAYAKDISRKISVVMKEKRLRGEFVGGYAPYGYVKDPENPNHLVVDPEIAPIVQEIFELRAAGKGIDTLCRELNLKGYPSPGRLRYERGIHTCNNQKGSNLLWNRHVLIDLLRNIVYIGNLAQGRSGSCLYKGIPFHFKDQSEWDVATDTHEPIISLELWERVQAINEKRSEKLKASLGKNADLPKRENPYGKLLRCADCGRVMKQVRTYNRKATKDYYNYKCPTYIELGGKACSPKNIKADVLDAAVLEIIRKQMALFLETQNVLRRLMAQATTEGKTHNLQQQKQRIVSELESKEKISTALYADFKEGLLSQSEYLYAKQQYQAETAALEQELYELEHSESQTAEAIIGEKKWSSLITRYYNAETLTAEMVSAMVKEILFHEDSSITITFLYEDEFQELLAQCEKIREGVA